MERQLGQERSSFVSVYRNLKEPGFQKESSIMPHRKRISEWSNFSANDKIEDAMRSPTPTLEDFSQASIQKFSAEDVSPACQEPKSQFGEYLFMSSTAPNSIRLRGVCQNNLKHLDLDLPLGKLIVVTGLSGAGKSSLVFETLHAEGQRRYVETFSPYTRQFMEMLDRPKVDSIENIRPSIAIEQGNTVKTSRSTVGTMTELTDYLKVWFSHAARLIDPETGKPIVENNPASIWKQTLRDYREEQILIGFTVRRHGKLTWKEIFKSLSAQGYIRIAFDGSIQRIDDLRPEELKSVTEIQVIQDRIRIVPRQRNRFIDSATTALHFGEGVLTLLNEDGELRSHFFEGLRSSANGRKFRPATPNLFSFNSPLGACPQCRGFGRVIEIDPRLVVPDTSLSIEGGAIRAFQGAVYSESQRDLIKACKKKGVPINVPWRELSEAERSFIYGGDPDYGKNGYKWPKAWYGISRFFEWLESNTYKMHVRVFLAKYRAYVDCPDCKGTRLQPESLAWQWQGRTLPELCTLPISELHQLLQKELTPTGDKRVDLATDAILTRLNYLVQVGVGYLTLNRSARTLSGGENQRVNLTSCLGTSLVDTLFILDEPSIGLHPRDIDRLTGILRQLTRQGNTVVVVEHDESVMQAADLILEIGPKPGRDGGEVIFAGNLNTIRKDRNSITGAYLSGRENISLPEEKRKVTESGSTNWLHFRNASKHNLRHLDLKIPLNRLVAISGVSGSGKSTLLNNVIYQGLLAQSGRASEDPAQIGEIILSKGFSEIVLVDQSPASRTPRSNPALFVDAWDGIRELFARTDAAQSAGMTASHFSFNSGQGRCEHCQGMGYERIEMQFMADVFTECPVCLGQRFQPDIREVEWNGKNVNDVLRLTVDEAVGFFTSVSKIQRKLEALQLVGLGYLTMGQPLNTLSGGESQRLKLVRYLSRFDAATEQALLLLDEPTTGLHRHDVKRLINVLQRLVDAGHSLVVIEHQIDVLKCADWLIELGPEAGEKGGRIVFAGPPESAIQAKTATAPYLQEAIKPSPSGTVLIAAESSSAYKKSKREAPAIALQVVGAREHNLKNISTTIPHGEITVVTGVSGSGKSSLAFDIIFAEGQRRFMESMSPWARQFIEQLPRPDIDKLAGIPPTVAIEQRVTHGSRKSTVATITEVAQYLRLLYARIGIQHSPVSGQPLIAHSPEALLREIKSALDDWAKTAGQTSAIRVCSPLIRGRKGHHEPLAKWAAKQGYRELRIDGKWVDVKNFKRLDRYREHDIEVVVFSIHPSKDNKNGWTILSRDKSENLKSVTDLALKLGRGSCFLVRDDDPETHWYSQHLTDPATGTSYPDLDPKHFSWNSARGWCPTCLGYGSLFPWMRQDERFENLPKSFQPDDICPECEETRLNPVSRSVFIHLTNGEKMNLPALLGQTPASLLIRLRELRLDARGRTIMNEVLPEIEERLRFMDEVGLGYLTLDRSTSTLSGGEAQRIRLAAQLGSNLSGVLYVLDEPSIGLHARDNQKLLESLKSLKAKGNSLLIVEHDEDTMRMADQIIDLGPGAGRHGGEILASGKVEELETHPDSLTGKYLREGIPHPLRGQYRKLPKAYHPSRKSTSDEWLVLEQPVLRNLKGGRLTIPKGRLTMVCGISGAGKSTLIRDVLRPAVEAAIGKKSDRLTGKDIRFDGFKDVRNANGFRSVIEVDQSPIGKTPRSTPATYIGAFDIIRQYFGQIPEARIRGYSASTFSFNTKGGRCETCGGAGQVKLEMNFMPDTYVQCDDCSGKRYGPELLDLCWNGKNIADVLEMTFEEATGFFDFHPRLKSMLGLMVETGLGYLTLGQSSPTLSGGEAQRLKLVSELTKGLPHHQDRKRGTLPTNLYILEEPTIGLHLADCERLIELLHRLVDQSHTVIVIEHHTDLIAEADYLIEVGPGGGDSGGEIIYQGHLKGIHNCSRSQTAAFISREV